MSDKEAVESNEETTPRKSKKMLWILLGGVVLLAGGGGGFFFLSGSEETAGEAATETAENAEGPAGLVGLDTFLVNLNDPAGERYMKLTMRLAVVPESVADGVDEDELLLARIRDLTLTILMSRTFEELSGPLGKEGLRNELKTQLGTLLEDGEIRDVLFSEFIVQ